MRVCATGKGCAVAERSRKYKIIISITAVEGSMPVHTDGEILCVDGQHVEIELLSRQIEVICRPPGGA
jgi:hypothetical protein